MVRWYTNLDNEFEKPIQNMLRISLRDSWVAKQKANTTSKEEKVIVIH
jgi:uncharacterized lipoprotein YmbA